MDVVVARWVSPCGLAQERMRSGRLGWVEVSFIEWVLVVKNLARKAAWQEDSERWGIEVAWREAEWEETGVTLISGLAAGSWEKVAGPAMPL